MCHTAEIEKAPRNSFSFPSASLHSSIQSRSVSVAEGIFFISVTLEDKANKTERGKNIYCRSMSDCRDSSTKYFPHVFSHYGVSSVEISKGRR